MTTAQKYRRTFDGSIVDAFQYGEDEPWTNDAVTKVVEFVTGIDVENHTGIANERVLDVVVPILTDWDASAGKAPIMVADTKTKTSERVDLGDWIIKLEDGSLVFAKHNVFLKTYEPVKLLPSGTYRTYKEMEIEELATFLYKDAFAEYEMDFPEGIAHLVAPKIISAGWRKVQ
jgi:hypothetical protein